MSDKYQPLRDAIAGAGRTDDGRVFADPDTIAALLKERDALRDAADNALNALIGCAVPGDGADDHRTLLEAQQMLRAALADGEEA